MGTAGGPASFTLEGMAPLSAEQRLLMILTEDVTPIHNRRRDIPEGLAAVIHRSLIKNPPELRFPDARTMRQALLPFTR